TLGYNDAGQTTDGGGDLITTGDDEIHGNGGDDTIYAMAGNDLVYGGDGDDNIHGDNSPVTNTIGPMDDTLHGDAGNDFISGNSGEDLIFGGDDNDTIYGGADNDSVKGDAGNDTISGDSGEDLLSGGTGDDTIYGGTGDDRIGGGDGEDAIYVNDGTSSDHDTVDAGDGADTIYAGFGDHILGGQNAGTAGDGSASADNDVLDFTSAIPTGGSYTIDTVSDTASGGNGNGFDGTVRFYDSNGDETGKITFEDIETFVMCFTPGTMIKTRKGEVDVAKLRVGDKVLTRDNGFQAVRWVGAKTLDQDVLAAKEELRPVRISKGALGDNLPERDMLVSPQHRMLVGNAATELWFGSEEVLVAAKHLTCLAGVEVVGPEEVTYIHVMFDAHEIICGDGSWTESFQPGDQSLGSLDSEARSELFELFPELADGKAEAAYPAARQTLKAHEAPLIFVAE
ncbi:MAG: Hint domain-containing protein, partial [Planktomarina sp.]